MTPDDAGDEELGFGRPPLPPEDRLWRHPSELGVPSAVATATTLATDTRRPALWTVALVASLAGATLSTGVIAATRSLDRRVVDRPIVEKVALTPVVSSPMLEGEPGVARLVEHLRPTIVGVEAISAAGSTAGSGVLYRDDGLLLTSAHLVDGATTIRVDLADGRRLKAALVGVDALTGIAVVDLDGHGHPVATLGSSEALSVGAPTLAIGAPTRAQPGPTVTTGVISALDRRVAGPMAQPLHGMIQVDTPLEPGSSGGALVDEHGALIGILSAVGGDDGDHFGYATPIDTARRIAGELMAHGYATHCWLGVEGSDLSAERADVLSLTAGAIVDRIAKGSPAERAGLAVNDVITEMDGEPILSVSHLVLTLRSHSPGDRVTIGYWRLGQHAVARVTLVARP